MQLKIVTYVRILVKCPLCNRKQTAKVVKFEALKRNILFSVFEAFEDHRCK